MLFQRICPGCGARGVRSAPCGSCRHRLESSAPVELSPPLGLDRLVVLHRYDPAVRGLVLAAKNGGRRPLLRLWGRQLAGLIDDGSPVDAVTWVPASRQGARRRGYDQGRILARAAAAAAGRPARRLLVRRPGPTRAGADRRHRLVGPDLRCPISVPRRVLLLDDVVTTGASMSAAAQALRSAGADQVIGLVVAAAGNDPKVRS